MKIRTYVADNVQEAFYKVKSDLGKDAVILQTKHIKKGGFLGLFAKRKVEVVAANDINPKSERLKKENFQPLANISLNTKNWKTSEEIDDLKADIKEVKNLINKLYSGQSQKRNVEGCNFPSSFEEFYNRMHKMQVKHDLINNLIDGVMKEISETEIDDRAVIYNKLKNRIVEFVNTPEPIQVSQNNVVAFVGPTGVGKTTTIAKIAAHFSLYENKKVAMITADTFRVGAIEQLKLYGDLLEIPVMVIYKPEDVKEIMSDLKDRELLLVDTMGFNPNNRMQIKKVKGLMELIKPTDIHLVVSAATNSQDIADIINNYKELKYNKIIITKLDETKSYGVILNVLHLADCRLSYFTAGQNVPDDIEIPSPDKIAHMILGEPENV